MAGTMCTTEHQGVAELGPISGFPERRPVARPERTFHGWLAGAFRDHAHEQSAPRDAVVIVDLGEACHLRPSDEAV